MSKKYYAVVKGWKPGIYTDWFGGAKEQVEGYKGAIFKGFTTRQGAEEFIQRPTYGNKRFSAKPKKPRNKLRNYKSQTTNHAKRESFYNGEKPPWEYEGEYITCIETVQQQTIDTFCPQWTGK